jgi:anti-sigma factor RsiW
MISARLDGRLSSAEDGALDNHLAACSTCRGEWEALSSVDRALSAAPVLEAPLQLQVRVLARLERRRRVRGALLGGSALFIGALFLSLLALSPVVGWVIGAGSLLPMWQASGPEMVRHTVVLLSTIVRAGGVLLRAFALPVVAVGAGVVVFAVLINGLWLGALVRLRAGRARAR